MRLKPTPRELLFSKNDPLDPRLGERTITPDLMDLQASGVCIWGLPDDEGIRMNGGRPGAANAPTEIRRAFYKMTPPARGPFPSELNDLGDLDLSGTLAERHERARQLARDCHQASHFTISFGGGHDYGYSDGAGFLDVYATRNPLVVNFDAHLDVRPMDKGPHSGTPFRRLLELFPRRFEFWELGLQPQCNAKSHADWAEQQGAHLVFLEDLLQSTPELVLPDPDTRRPCLISVDIDAFSNKEAPGCSQSFASGLLFETFLPWLDFLITSYDVRGIHFYEVSPTLDLDNRTSKLAALILYHTLRLRAQKGSQ